MIPASFCFRPWTIYGKMMNRKNHWEQFGFWLFALLGELLSFWALFQAMAEGKSWLLFTAAALLHLAAAGFLFVPSFVLERHRKSTYRYEWHLYGWMVLFMPYIGMVGSALVALARGNLRREDALRQYQEFTKRERYRDLYLEPVDDAREIISKALDIEPIRDILRTNDVPLKTGAIQYLTSRPSPDAVWMIQQCISDESEEVRYFAHLALVELEEQYMSKINDIQERTQKHYAGRAEAFKMLGGIYREYLKSGLVDEKATPFYSEQARKAFLSARELLPDDLEVSMALGELSAACGDYQAAGDYYRETLKDERFVLEAWLGIFSACYEKGDIKELAVAVREAGSVKDYHTENSENIQRFEFWVRPEEA